MQGFWEVSIPYWHFLFRGAFVYMAILILLRIGGKRQIGQMGAGEFVAILLISNAVQNSMNGGDNSITGGLILAAVIVGLSWLVEYLSYKSKRFEGLFEGHPTMLIHKGKILRKNLEKELINVHELKTLLRKQGIHDFSEIYEAILESDGSISVTKCSELKEDRFSEDVETTQP
ncbi:MAG TPA: YetF domain-containing protein [bacterium]|nr:YetF domain-containing protein [bacterium]